ncbi:MAG: 54S ribosomal protein L17 mitochondrial [Chaenotheca gracillima]|nr:MAG: 54S ribosomal protein L17 mitochondrial [Chaenotheca gracillima]
MVCAKCQRLQKSTQLATPGVKRKSEMYYGSSASSKSNDKSKASSSTLGNNGIGKRVATPQSKLLSKSAKNPYAAYSSSCKTCKKKTEQGHSYCHGCAYKANACSMCGKSQNKEKSASGGPVVQGQRFSAK